LHWPHRAPRTPPEALQAGHSIQSLFPVALRFIPLHRFLSMIRLHFQFASWTLWPGVRQAVQQVTGICRFIGWRFYRIEQDGLHNQIESNDPQCRISNKLRMPSKRSTALVLSAYDFAPPLATKLLGSAQANALRDLRAAV
jgi:hypothetical protein